MDTYPRDILLATWPGGYRLIRRVKENSVTYSPSFILMIHECETVFFTRNYTRFFSNHPPSLLDRAVFFSAWVEVLSPFTFPYNLRDSSQIYSNTFFVMSLPIERPLQNLLHMEASELAWRIPSLQQAYDLESELPQSQREMIPQHRVAYVEQARAVMRALGKSINSKLTLNIRIQDRLSSWFTMNDTTRSGPGFWTTQPSEYNTGFIFVLSLDFVREPVWRVRICSPERKTYSSEIAGPDLSTATELSWTSRGPVTALLEANLVVGSTRAEQEAWMDKVVDLAPEPELVYDLESYHLLGTGNPLLLNDQAFLEWITALG